jgi:hypothetical protein
MKLAKRETAYVELSLEELALVLLRNSSGLFKGDELKSEYSSMSFS